jgi:DNA/RNA-binding protein KIN17
VYTRGILQGWYIQYIDRDPIVLARQEALERSKKKELDDQQRHEKLLDKLVKQAKETGGGGPGDDHKFTGLERRDGDDEPVKFELSGFGKKRAVAGGASGGAVPISVAFGDDADDDELKRVLATAPKPKEFKVPEFMQSLGSSGEDAAPAGANRPREPEPEPLAASTGDNWIAKGIIVKIMNNRVGGGKYYEAKGTILKVSSGKAGCTRRFHCCPMSAPAGVQIHRPCTNFGHKRSPTH